MKSIREAEIDRVIGLYDINPQTLQALVNKRRANGAKKSQHAAANSVIKRAKVKVRNRRNNRLGHYNPQARKSGIVKYHTEVSCKIYS